MVENTLTPLDFFNIVKRRKWSLIVPFFVILLLSVIVALIIPSYYKSTATILIEEQEIPTNFVMATVTSYAEQRLQSINQRVMSSTRLLQLIKRFDLYPDLEDKLSTDEIISKMREDIKLETTSVDLIDRRTGRPTKATIAFTLSYEGRNAEKVQRTTTLLTSYFLQENIDVREKQTTDVSQFLKDEMNKVKTRLEAIDQKISSFKKKHIHELPELLQVNLQSLNNTEQSVDRLYEQLKSIKEREGYLQTQLSALTPKLTYDTARKHLELLKVQLVKLKTKFSDEYPDVSKLRAEISDLTKKLKISDKTSGHYEGNPDNPAYVTLSSQLASTKTEITSVKRQINEMLNRRDEYNRRIASTPRIESKYRTLIDDRKNTRAKYDDLMQKYMEARMAHGLEKEQKGERFTLIDPARLPEKPFKPNRLAIIFVGLVLGSVGGVTLASFMEFLDDSIRNPLSLSMDTSFPILAGIPYLDTKNELLRRKRMRLGIIAGIPISIIIGLIMFHFFVMDLDILWAQVRRKLIL